MIKGNDIIFYFEVGGDPIAFCHATSWNIRTDNDLLETTTKSGLKGKTFEYARKYGYVLNISGLATLIDEQNFYTLQQQLGEFEKLDWLATDNLGFEYRGTVLISSTGLDAPLDQIATFSGDLQGDGDYTQAGYTPPTPVGNAVIIKDQFDNVIASVPAPGTYNVLRFSEIYDDLLMDDTTIITDSLLSCPM